MKKNRLEADIYYRLLLSDALSQEQKIKILRQYQPKLQTDKKEYEQNSIVNPLWEEFLLIMHYDFTYDNRFQSKFLPK